MSASRSLLHVALALLFFVQTFAVAAAERSPARATMQAMPCHSAHGSAAKPSCCNAACPDMLSCALAAISLPSAAFAWPAIAEPLPAGVIASPRYPAAPPGAAFRPPIELPA
jgi:hypothetical protein